MKKRNFYPRQVLRKLQGEHSTLDAGQNAALRYLLRRGRRLGYSVQVGPAVNSGDFPLSGLAKASSVLLSNVTTRILLKPTI